MVGYPWRFTVSPNSITEVSVTCDGRTIVLEISKSDFSTSSFAEGSTAVISATGYQDVTTTVGTSSITMTVAPATPDYVSKLSDGTTTYIIKDAEARTSLAAKQDSSTAVTHTASTAVGGTTTPVYIASNGAATALSYTLAKSVPSNAVFTDTTYTGSDGVVLTGTNFTLGNIDCGTMS